MKRFLIILVLIFAFLGCEKNDTKNEKSSTNVKPLRMKSKTPILTFTEKEYNFGNIKPLNKVTHDFKFKNTGKQPLIIENIRSSCGCTTIKLSKKEYESGEIGIITATFNPRNYKRAVTKTVTITSNDPLKRRVILALKAYVIIPIVVNNSNLNFGEVRVGNSKSMTIKIQSGTVKKFNIKNVNIPPALPFIGYTSKKEEGEGRTSYALTFTAKPISGNYKSFSGIIKINTDSNEAPVLRLTTRGIVLGPIDFYPRTASLAAKKGNYYNYSISFSSNQKFMIKSAQLNINNPNLLKTKIISLVKEHSYIVSLYSDHPINRNSRGNLIVTTNKREQSTITIPVNIRIR